MPRQQFQGRFFGDVAVVQVDHRFKQPQPRCTLRQVTAQPLDPRLMAEKTVAAEQDPDAAFACTTGVSHQPAHGAPDLKIILADVRLIRGLIDVGQQGNHRHAGLSDLGDGGIDHRVSEADHRQAIALHRQLFDLSNDGARCAIEYVLELTAQVGAGLTLRRLGDGGGNIGIERLGGTEQEDAETIAGTPFADPLTDQPGGEITDRFGGLEYLLGGGRADRRPGVEHPVHGGDTQPSVLGDRGDGGAFSVVHGGSRKRLDRKLSSLAGPG